MKRKQGWFVALVLVALVLASCGPSTPTAKPPTSVAKTPTTPQVQPTQGQATAQPTPQPTPIPVDWNSLTVDSSDWHVYGNANAPVTLVEYFDFQ